MDLEFYLFAFVLCMCSSKRILNVCLVIMFFSSPFSCTFYKVTLGPEANLGLGRTDTGHSVAGKRHRK